MPFALGQTQVNTQPAIGVEGDFCDHNPRVSVPIGPGGFVTGALGCTVGRFAWWAPNAADPDSAPIIVNNFYTGIMAPGTPGGPTNAPTGFIHREQQGLNVTYLSDATMFIPQGFPLTLMMYAGVLVRNAGAGQAFIGQKAYADLATGQVTFAATGSASTATSTGSTIAIATGITSVGQIVGNIMTTASVSAGTIVVGAILSGTGVVTGTQVVSQLSGTAGGAGVYVVSPGEQTVASGTTISGTYGILTVASAVGTWKVGALVGGGTTAANTFITSLGTGSGGNGTYNVNISQTVASAALTGTTNVETKFVAISSGLAGELIKISPWLIG